MRYLLMATGDNSSPSALRDMAAAARRLAGTMDDEMAAKTLLREAQRYEEKAQQIESASPPEAQES